MSRRDWPPTPNGLAKSRGATLVHTHGGLAVKQAVFFHPATQSLLSTSRFSSKSPWKTKPATNAVARLLLVELLPAVEDVAYPGSIGTANPDLRSPSIRRSVVSASNHFPSS